MVRTPIALIAVLAAVLLPGTAHAAPAPPPRPGPPSAAEAPHDCVSGQWPWGCVADCESGGRWDADTGNGFYGGLQFLKTTWEEFGGLTFAPRADLATREQQIAIGQEVLAFQGWEAWPACSKRYRLAGRMHTVKPGDTLTSIARKYGVREGWRGLYAVNRKTVGHPDRLTPGALLLIPKDATRGGNPDRAPAVFGPPLGAAPARPSAT